MEGQPAKQMGMSVEQQHACAQQEIWGRSGEEAGRAKQGRRGPPLPRQQELRLTKGACSFSVDFCVVPYFPPELIDVMCVCTHQLVRQVSFVAE